MEKIKFHLLASDGLSLSCAKYPAKENQQKKGVVQLVHGSLEHSSRYDGFADFLCQNGYTVYAMDLRGHGETAGSEENYAVFSRKGKGWLLALEDQLLLTEHIQKQENKQDIFLLGHSMGSFLIRDLVSEHGQLYKGMILSGTGGGRPALVMAARILAKLYSLVKGADKRSASLHKLVYGTLNDEIENPQTESDFITRDADVVQAYLADPFCGGTASHEYIAEMTLGILRCSKTECFQQTKKDLAIYMFSGEKDPVAGPKGDCAELKAVYAQYKSAGIQDIELKIYNDARHEMLNELNKDEVYKDVLAWLDAHVD